MKRIRILVLILCACFVSVAWSRQPAAKGDWTEFHRTNMERWNPYETVLGVNNVGNLQRKWSSSIGSVYSSPAVANGVVYVGGGNDVYALKGRTGAKLWRRTIGFVGSSPAVANGVVYVGGGNNVYALKAGTGALLWSYTTGSYVFSSPAVANGVVYVGAGYGGYNVYALNASTGTVLWSHAAGYDGDVVARGGEWGGLYRRSATTTSTR